MSTPQNRPRLGDVDGRRDTEAGCGQAGKGGFGLDDLNLPAVDCGTTILDSTVSIQNVACATEGGLASDCLVRLMSVRIASLEVHHEM